MSLIAVVGEGSTTTAVGLVSAWPLGEPCSLVEFDPAGGCLSAWLDTPQSPGLVDVTASSDAGSWLRIESAFQRSTSGLDVLVAPHRTVEASTVIAAASVTVLPVLSALQSPVFVADGGRLRGGLSPLTTQAGLVVISHRQHSGSAAASALGLQRVADLCEALRNRALPHVIALIGQRPYAADEVADFVGTELVIPIADDSWAAAVVAGRAGSAIRFRRSALMKSMTVLAGAASACLRQSQHELVWDDQAGSSL